MGAGAIRCLLLAQSRHAQCADECPLLASDQPLLTNRDLLVHGLVTKPHSSRIMGSQPPPVGPVEERPPRRVSPEWQERVSGKLGEPLKPRSWTEWMRSWMPSWLPKF